MEGIVKAADIPGWIPFVLIGCMVLMAAAKLVDSKRFDEFLLLPVTNKYFMVHGKAVELFTPFNMFLLTVQLFSVSLFAFYLIVNFSDKYTFQDTVLFVQVFCFYTLFVAVKFYIEKIIGDLFSIENKINSYLYAKLSHKNWLAIPVLAVNFLVFYAFKAGAVFAVICVSFLVFLNVFLLIYSFRSNQKYLAGNLFYFILYLCTLEILPYYLLYKWIAG